MMLASNREQMNQPEPSSESQLLLNEAQQEQSGTGFCAGFTSIDRLLQNRRNVRRRTPRSRQMVRESLTEFGAARSVVVDENGEILCGNGTVEAAADLGITSVLVIPTDGKTLVAVQRCDLDSTQKAGLMLADNRSSDTSVDDGAALQRLMEEERLLDISSWYSEEEIAALSADIDTETQDQAESAPSKTAAAAGMEIRLTFASSEAFQRFNGLLQRLTAALPEQEEVSARLETAIHHYLASSNKSAKTKKP